MIATLGWLSRAVPLCKDLRPRRGYLDNGMRLWFEEVTEDVTG